MIRVSVNPDLLRWARERSGITRESLAVRFKKLPEWEDGTTQPTLKQVEAFARAVHVPVGYLFLTEPPEEAVPIPDFRTFPGREVARPSPNLLDTIYMCQERQSWYRDFVRVAGQPERDFVGNATVETPVETVADEMREPLRRRPRQRGRGDAMMLRRGRTRSATSKDFLLVRSEGCRRVQATFGPLRRTPAPHCNHRGSLGSSSNPCRFCTGSGQRRPPRGIEGAKMADERATTKDFLGVRSEGRWWVRARCRSAAASASRTATIEETTVVSWHVGDAYRDGELEWEATVAKSATVRREGGRSVRRRIEHFNLDVIISPLTEPSG